MSKKITQEEFENRVYQKYDGKFSVVGEYVNWRTPIEIKCNQCNNNFTRISASITSGNVCCPVCDSAKVTNSTIYNLTDLWGTDPEIANLLEDPQIGHKYKRCSDIKTVFICPDCNYRNINSIAKVTSRGFKCKLCGGTISYPNQFLYSILDQIGICFKPEYIIHGYPYRYDAFFIYDNDKYLIEMDGAYGHGCIDTANRTKHEQIMDDFAKDQIAKDNGYKLIRIDCKYRDIEIRFEYIKKSIINSDLYKILNIPDCIFETANKNASMSKLEQVVDLWNDGVRSYSVYTQKLHKHRATIRKYLFQASEIGIIAESYDEILKQMRIESNHSISVSKGQPIICNETGMKYNSMSEAERLTGISSIRDYFCKNRKYAGTLQDGTKLTWTKI